ncbi:Deoxyhypusine synthase [Candidatus Magnetomorum sp. HK-1]|nr:Deoxyhypusine synthase [Candidatus Magnetomorum sp. HK-1]
MNIFNRNRLKISPLSERCHDLNHNCIMDLKPKKIKHETLHYVARAINNARLKKASIVFMMGAHVIRSGVQRYIIDLMEKGFISCIAMNGAGLIHDFEFALIGKTTENVSNYIKDDQSNVL